MTCNHDHSMWMLRHEVGEGRETIHSHLEWLMTIMCNSIYETCKPRTVEYICCSLLEYNKIQHVYIATYTMHAYST